MTTQFCTFDWQLRTRERVTMIERRIDRLLANRAAVFLVDVDVDEA
jgi:hypothetical protein